MPSFRSLFAHAPLRRILLANLFIAFHTYLGLYVNSSYLKVRMGESDISIAYVLGALVSLTSFFLVALLLPRFGAWRLLLGLILLQAGALIVLTLGGTLGSILVAFVLYQSLVPLLLFGLDIFIETTMTNEQGTGTVRGLLLTTTNLALVLSPLIAGLLIGTTENFRAVYGVALLMLAPLLVLTLVSFRTFQDPHYHATKLSQTLTRAWHDRNVFHIVCAHLNMRIFFAFMVVYLPLYLHNHIGFSWPMIGGMLSIALLPYLLMELPAGRIADKVLGEKELLAVGFIIAAMGTALFALPLGASFLVWTGVLLFSRIGASLIEIMTESYFFKHVRGDDADLVTLFRILQPISYLVGPALAAVTLALFPYHALWYVLAAILLLGLVNALSIEDTR